VHYKGHQHLGHLVFAFFRLFVGSELARQPASQPAWQVAAETASYDILYRINNYSYT
jgi:hypothetical protein